MNGPTVLLAVAVVVGPLVLAFLVVEARSERWRAERDDRESLAEWERLKRDLGPRSIP